MNDKLIDRFFALITEQPTVTDARAAELLECTPKTVETYRYRLKARGCIDVYVDDAGVRTYRIILPYREEKAPASEAAVCYHMVDKFLVDFDEAETFEKRVLVGKEIRMLLELARAFRRK